MTWAKVMEKIKNNKNTESNNKIRRMVGKMAESTVTTHSVESKPILESKLRRFKILSAVLAIALVVLAVYAFRADIILLIKSYSPIAKNIKIRKNLRKNIDWRFYAFAQSKSGALGSKARHIPWL